MDYIDKLKFEMKTMQIDDCQINICVQYAENLLLKNSPVIFDVEHLRKILILDGVNLESYIKFQIINKNKIRHITSPSKKLKERQNFILKNILEKIEISNNAHGFVKNRSIVTNARLHVAQTNILNMDIKDFFPSIKQDSVFKVFNDIGYTTPVSKLLSEICCKDGCLPQGAPSSPLLSNIICYQMDKDIQNLASSIHATFTRYADDITLSSNNFLTGCVNKIEKILNKYGFKSNIKKTRLVSGEKRKLVTGLLVNTEVKIPKNFKRQLTQQIYYCKKFGVTAHLENSKAKKFVNFREHLYGKAYYVNMVEPELGQKFLKDLDDINWL